MRHYDIAIIGAGPAGMRVANALSDTSLDIAIIDEANELGGQIYRHIQSNLSAKQKVNQETNQETILGKDYYEGSALIQSFYQGKSVTHIKNVTVWSIDKNRHIIYADGNCSHKISATKIVIAVGAYERPYLINGWDLPGVMSASAAQILLKTSGLIEDNAVFIGTGPLMYYILDQYLKAGATIKAFIDTNPFSNYIKALKGLHHAIGNIPLLLKGMAFFKTMSTHRLKIYKYAHHLTLEGDNRVEGISFYSGKKRHHIQADRVFIHQGLIPNIHLQLQAGCAKFYAPLQKCWNIKVDDFGQSSVKGIFCIGDGQELRGLPSTLKQAELCALQLAYQFKAIDEITFNRAYKKLKKAFIKTQSIRGFLDRLYQPLNSYQYSVNEEVTFCRCENITLKAIKESIRGGTLNATKIKAFTRSSMGMCQGRFCALSLSQLLQDEYGVKDAEALYHKPRVPIKPISLGELATITQ